MAKHGSWIGYQRNRNAWRVVLALPLTVAFNVQTLADGPADETLHQLRSAMTAADRKDFEAAQTYVVAAISNPAFPSLDQSARHAALALAASLHLQSGKLQESQQFARRATQMPEQSAEDWRVRLAASTRLRDRRDEAISLAAIAQRWGRDRALLTDGTVRQVIRDTDHGEANDARFELLQALYELRWHPTDGASVNPLWVELSRLLLERDREDEAYLVASLADDPRSAIAFHADRRLQPLLKSKFVRANPRQTALDYIATLRTVVKQQPRSLMAVRRLIAALSQERQDAEAIKLSEQTETHFEVGGSGTASYDDVGDLGVILDLKSSALRHLGRDEEAVQQLQRAVNLPQRADRISQDIDLALLLCDLGRSSEALALLPAGDKISDFGNMRVALVQLTAAIDRGAAADEEKALNYLRAHRLDAPSVAQRALVRAGALDEAEQLLLWRLKDPSLRTSALLSVQNYFEPHQPPRAAEWRARELEIENRASIRSVISQFGEVDHYPWTYGYD